MWYSGDYASPLICSSPDGRRADSLGDRPAVVERLYRPPLPDAPRQCERQPTTAIARTLRCNDQTVRNAIHAFNHRGPAALPPRSSRPHTTQAVFDGRGGDQLRALLHQRPRTFGKATGVWILKFAAEVSFAQGLTPREVSGETIWVPDPTRRALEARQALDHQP